MNGWIHEVILITDGCRIGTEADLIVLMTDRVLKNVLLGTEYSACMVGRRKSLYFLYCSWHPGSHFLGGSMHLGGASFCSPFKVSAHALSVIRLSFPFQSKGRMLRRKNSDEQRVGFSGLHRAGFSSSQGQSVPPSSFSECFVLCTMKLIRTSSLN